MVFAKKHKLSITIILILFLLTGVIIFAINNETIRNKLGLEKYLKINPTTTVSLVPDEAPLVTECLNGESLYRSDVLGIKFCYPAKWGDAETNPIQYLTSLSESTDAIPTSEDNEYSNSIHLTFSQNKNMEFRFFNEKFNGKYYPNSRALEAGYVDNISELKESGDICDYNINFDGKWEGKNTLKTIWSDCSRGVKNILTKDDQYFTPILYVEKLSSHAFEKLENGYFDNLLITYTHGSTRISTIGATSLENFFSKKPLNNITDEKVITNDDYLVNKEELIDLLGKISIYKPVERKQEDFKTIDNENPNLTLIRKYYWNLTGQKMEEAAKMISSQRLNLAEFQNNNKDFYSGVPRDFTILSDNQVDFYLDYQAENSKPTVYHKVVKITDGKLAFSLSDEITTEMVRSGIYTAYAKRTGNKNYMILKENNQEVVVDEGEAAYNNDHSNLSKVEFYVNPVISSKEKYLTYQMVGYEWAEIHFYDIKNHRAVFSYVAGADFGMDKDETHGYICASATVGMTSSTGKVFSLETGKTLLNVYDDKNNEEYSDISCKYDSDQEIILMTLSGETSSKSKMIRYDPKSESTTQD